jgi:monovalent cation:H+ antiporter-2, CPA2 family
VDNVGLLVNLVFAIGAASIAAVVAVRLRQSVILGYILAGIAIGPFTPGFVADVASVQELADLGVIFLMFAVGAQLSLADLRRVGKVVSLGGSMQVLAVVAAGYAVGEALGWRPLESLFFGAVLSNSSSTVLGKLLGERGETDAEHGRIALAWSSVQDLGTIALVILLSSLATGAADGASLLLDLASGLARATVFLALLLPVGTRVLPWLFEQIAALRSRELFLLAVAAIALGTAYLSTFFGLSLALGAFVAGVAVSESDLSHQIIGEILPLRDVLAALFFVSVGMLFDPMFVFEHAPMVLLTLALIVVLKGTLSAGLTWAFGYGPRTVLLVGVGLAQSAEFSFLLARLGTELGVVSPAVFSLMLAGAVASIVLAPALQMGAAPISNWLERRLEVEKTPPPFDLGVPGVASRPPRHAVLCGYGQVGRLIGLALRRRGFRVVVIDQDPRVVSRLRERGIPAYLGNASNPILLERVRLSHARILIVAIPDALAARQIVELARMLSPRVEIIVRTHSEVEARFLERRGASEAVVGERELALEMARHTLRRFGVSAAETFAMIQGLRTTASALDEDPRELVPE